MTDLTHKHRKLKRQSLASRKINFLFWYIVTCAAFVPLCGAQLYTAWVDRTVKVRGSGTVESADSPMMFFFVVIGTLGLATFTFALSLLIPRVFRIYEQEEQDHRQRQDKILPDRHSADASE